MRKVRISVIVPTFAREEALVATVRAIVEQCQLGDEVIVVDQTPRHSEETKRSIAVLRRRQEVRWYDKARPGICEAMNVGALLARNPVLLFLDDDVQPGHELLETYREIFSQEESPQVVNGQILQPWNERPVDVVRDFGLGFDFAYCGPAEIVPLVTCNCAVQRTTFLEAGGMDETYEGGAHRCDADLGFALKRLTGKPARFEPRASVRHLRAEGGTRAHGAKDSWASLGSAVGDHYFGLRWLGTSAAGHSTRRVRQALFNRRTLREPWRIPILALREAWAFARAVWRVASGPPKRIRELAAYPDVRESPLRDPVGRSSPTVSRPGAGDDASATISGANP